MSNNNNSDKSEKEMRSDRLAKLMSLGIEAYPAESNRTHSIKEALNLSEGKVTVSGRLVAIRSFGKLSFGKIQDMSGQIQVMLKSDELDNESFQQFIDLIDLGDIVEFCGERMQTKKGEESVLIKKWTLLNKTLRPLPDEFYGLKDKELRFRKRYLDLITNRDVFELFKNRSKIITLIRNFLNARDCIEMETPILQSLYGGTNAKPFETKINAYKMDMYLRVAPELYLKRLLVGGYEKCMS